MKKYILGLVTGVILTTAIAVCASYAYNAKEVIYKDTNVERAITDLYSSISSESVQELIPTLSANTNNIISNITTYSNAGYTYPLYKAFDGDDTTGSISAQSTAADKYIGYMFDEKHYVNYVRFNLVGNGSSAYTFKVQYNDGTTWLDVGESDSSETMLMIGKYCFGIRIYFTGTPEYLHLPGSYGLYINTIQAYGH